MKNQESIKTMVREKYTAIATQSQEENSTSCCGTNINCCDTVDYSVFAEDYSVLKGYQEEADLGLGCGIPTKFAQINEGDTVVDLGSGAGNDCFVARQFTGETGKVIGIDMTEAMIAKAYQNTQKAGFNNVSFVLGDLEAIPLENGIADVVVSNCVFNLVPDKKQAFQETFRILKNKGHFSISDVVLEGELPEGLTKDAEMYAGCVSGAIQKDVYLKTIAEAGFTNIQIQKEKEISLPDEILQKYLSEEEITFFQKNKLGIYSITVYAEKPCCDSKSACC